MTEYKGEEFRKPFCEALAKGPVGWQYYGGPDWCYGIGLPTFGPTNTYRFKPMPKRMVTMYDRHGKPHQLVAPERDEPKMLAEVFLENPLGGVIRDVWRDTGQDKSALQARVLFLTREDAQAMAEFQREQREGA